MNSPLARLLKDFGEPKPAPPTPSPLPMDGFLDSAAEDLFEQPETVEVAVDLEAERAEAFERGRQAATEELQLKFEEERAALIAAHEEEIRSLQEKLGPDTVSRVTAQIQDAAGDVAQAVSEQVAHILAPILDEALIAKAMADMADIIRAAMLEGDPGTLVVYGPQHLFEKLKTALGEPTPLFRHVEAPDLDITVDIAETTYVTRMSAWSASLKKVLG